MRTIFAMAVASVCATPAQATDITGFWITHDATATIEMAPCGDAVCGRIVAFDGEQDARDMQNPEPALQTRPICGLEVLSGLTPARDDRWRGGRLYDPRTGDTYDASASIADDHLRLRAFIGIEVFGETLIWSRGTPPAAACAAAP